MNKILQTILLLLSMNISVLGQENLKLNSTIKLEFNELEIEELGIILGFFENNICTSESINEKRINLCYQEYSKRIKQESESNGDFYLNLPFEEQLEIYKRISPSTFNEIWTFGKSYPLNSATDTLKYLTLNNSGKYSKFLKETGKTDKVIELYYNSFEATGEISPSMFGSVIDGYEYYNLNDIRIRLMLAIHFLTINDQFYRKEKY